MIIRKKKLFGTVNDLLVFGLWLYVLLQIAIAISFIANVYSDELNIFYIILGLNAQSFMAILGVTLISLVFWGLTVMLKTVVAYARQLRSNI